MHWIDWLVVAGVIGAVSALAVVTSRYTKSVSDFLAANRCAGRYLLSMAMGMSGLGAISIAANFEKFFHAGFAALWWGQILAPLAMILALSGWVTYRYRETRALTLAEFFERRYSRNFRIFTGILAFVAGVLNYGIFPAVTGRFIIYFCGLPPTVELGSIQIPTLAVVMFVMLGTALAFTMAGGQITVIVTDFIQGQFVNIVTLLVIAVIFLTFDWNQIVSGLKMAPEGESRLNPFDQGNVPDFNLWFFIILAFLQVYGHMAWQGSQAYNASATSAHEARMARILGEFRGMVTYLVMILLPVCIYAMLQLPEFSAQAEATAATLAQIPDAQIQDQMTVPAGLAQILPVGVMGLFAAVIAIAAISTDDTYLHSWGSIFIQDVVMPFRKRPFTQRQHLLMLRLAMLGVAAFAFTFSLIFPLNEYIYMYFQITGAIFLGGAGSVIIGGLYWSRGTTAGAWWGMIIGSGLATVGIVTRNIVWPQVLPRVKAHYPNWTFFHAMPEEFPFNGVQMAFFAALCAIIAYVVVSLASRQRPVNMDKLLHRGRFALPGEHPCPAPQTRLGWRLIGVGTEFTRGDKAIYLLKIAWTMFFFTVFVIGTAINLIWTFSEDAWARWWLFQILFTCVVAVITVVWFLVGGFRDLFLMLRTLKTLVRDQTDDGFLPATEREAPKVSASAHARVEASSVTQPVPPASTAPSARSTTK